MLVYMQEQAPQDLSVPGSPNLVQGHVSLNLSVRFLTPILTSRPLKVLVYLEGNEPGDPGTKREPTAAKPA